MLTIQNNQTSPIIRCKKPPHPIKSKENVIVKIFNSNRVLMDTLSNTL